MEKIRNSQNIPHIIVSSTIYNILTFRLLVWKIQPIQISPTEWPPKSARGYNSVTVSPRGLRLSQLSLGPKVTPYTYFRSNRRGSGVKFCKTQSFYGGMPQVPICTTYICLQHWLQFARKWALTEKNGLSIWNLNHRISQSNPVSSGSLIKGVYWLWEYRKQRFHSPVRKWFQWFHIWRAYLKRNFNSFRIRLVRRL